MRVLAIVPARSGSKRLPSKNIMPINGKPMMAWTIEEALKSKYISKVMVSTDSEEISNIGKEYGGESPYLRSKELSSDSATSTAVVIDALDFYESKGETYDYVMLLQPTSPLRTSLDIDRAVEKLLETNAKSIVSVCECDHSPLWTGTIDSNGTMASFFTSHKTMSRSQELPTFYQLNGAIYLVNVDTFLKEERFILEFDCYALIMSKIASVDIDDKFDFLFAETLMRFNDGG